MATDDLAPAAPRLPRSGIGVDGPYLVIAPTGNPTIRLDARLLDRVELIGRSPVSALAMATASVGGVAIGLLTTLPGGIFTGVGLGYLAIDRAREARRRVISRDLLLVLGELEVALHVADGPTAAKQLVDRLAPYARDAPIDGARVYEDARRRLYAHAEGRADAALLAEVDGALRVGEDLVHVRDGHLLVGQIGFRIEDVREHALRGANLPLPGGRLLQAALGLLVVAADARARAGEDVARLAKRVADYEAWSGRSAGR
ncbi:MAG: hypothetical protein R2939_05170 [Kofleriaceae bacterium]